MPLKSIRLFLTITVAIIASVLLPITAKEKDYRESYDYKRGVEAFENEQYRDAFDWFDREVKTNPKNGYAYVYIGCIYDTAGEYGNALTYTDLAVKYIPKKDKEWRYLTLMNRSKIYQAVNDTVKAINDLTEAIKLNPKKESAYENRGQLYFEMNELDKSDADYDALINLDKSSYMGHMGQIRNALERKDWQQAIERADILVKLYPNMPQLHKFRAEAYIGVKDYDKAATDIVSALDCDDKSTGFDVMSDYADVFGSELIAKMKVMAAKNPKEKFWPFAIGVVYAANDNYEEAISSYEKSAKIEDDWVTNRWIAHAYSSMDNDLIALDYLDKAMVMSPYPDIMLSDRFGYLYNLNRFDEAMETCDKIIAKSPDDVWSYAQRAELNMELERFENAIEDYEIMFGMSPEMSYQTYLKMKLGDAYRLTGKDKQAEECYRAMLAIDNDSIAEWTPFAYSGLGETTRSIEAMDYVLKTDTTDINGSLYNAACNFARLGMQEQALEYLDKAGEAGYTNWDKARRDYDLRGLRDTPEFNAVISKYEPMEFDFVEVSENTPTPDLNYLDIIELSPNEPQSVKVPFTRQHGVTGVKCSINGLPLYFMFDTGAADVTMSMVEANFMFKNGYLSTDDVIGSEYYQDANGDVTEGTVVNIKNVDFNGLELQNVRVTVVRNQRAPLLLGQSVLGRLGRIEIDNNNDCIVITKNSFSK